MQDTINYKSILRALMAGLGRRILRLPMFPQQEVKLVRTTATKSSAVPKVVWIYWEDDQLPDLIMGFVNDIMVKHPEYEINVLSRATLDQYLPDFFCHQDVPIANKTDLIRLDLLYRYGGIWLDATIILKEKLDWIYGLQFDSGFELTGFYRGTNTVDEVYPVIETWFLASPPGSVFIKNWLAEFSAIRTLGSRAYFELLRKRDDYRVISANIEPASYLLVYLACQIALRKTSNVSFYLRRAEDTAFYLQDYYKWNANVITYALTRLDATKCGSKIIKLTSGDRKLLNGFIECKLIRRKSFIGQLLTPGRGANVLQHG
ncbi:glycosyltransferase family 32 protein [Sphingobacterium suaedae]|uniref:Glycosyltransferase family 32 protein n=1 Tax=Sphingobacterium suaedae TaxID=1686402 RepID=A0ABW5KKP4_9SPHI